MNPFARIGSVVLLPVRFLQEVIVELKSVTWPTRQETLRSTITVVLISVGVGLYIASLDFGFTKLFSVVLSLKK